MKKTIAFAVSAILFASTIPSITVSAHPFIEYERRATLSDVVLCARAASGQAVSSDGIRLDVDNDGVVSDHDVDIMLDAVCNLYPVFDKVISIADHEFFAEDEELLCMEMAELYNTPFEYTVIFEGIRPDLVLPYYLDYIMIDRVWSISDGGISGFAIGDEPYSADILYDHEYECGDVVVIYNVYVGGDLVRQDEFMVGDCGEFGIDYQPRFEIVQNALRNLD